MWEFTGLRAGVGTLYARIIDKDGGFTQYSTDVQVDRKAASVTPDAVSKTYGDTDPTLTGTLNGFLTADNVTAAYNRATGETVLGSPYTISADLNPTSVLSNYDIAYNTAVFAITARPVTVSANSKSKIYGEPDPALTDQITDGSLIGSDSLSGSLTRVTGSNVGTYAITQGTLSAGSNYVLTYVGASFAITTKAIPVIPAASQSKTYGTFDPAFTYSGTLLDSDTFSGACR